MYKILFSAFVITAMVLFAVPQYVSAAMTWSTGFTTATNPVTIGIDTFGVGKPTVAATFTPSSGIQCSGNVSTDLNYFLVVTQHQKGDKAYGMHSSGGGMYYKAVVTIGTALTAPAVTAVATTDLGTTWGGTAM